MGVLDEFIAKNEIEALCIDSAPRGFASEFKCENVVVASRYDNSNLKDYSNLTLRGLDFEEFIAFYPRPLAEGAAFSHFLALGNSPECAKAASAEGLRLSFLARFEPLERKILSRLAPRLSSPLAALQVFREIKESEKLSKDRFYRTLATLEETGAIGFVASSDEKAKFRRVFFGDFALKSLLAISKDPRAVIANMVFCELAKMEQEPVFTSFADFVLAGRALAITVSPFSDPELAALRVKKRAREFLDLGITRALVVSNAGELKTAHEGLKIEISPFWRWASGIE